jgi:hypothetical protein
MLIATCADKEKCVPEGPGYGDFDGKPIRRQRGMIYWFRWGQHTFDIRVVRKLLGLPEDHDADKYFMPENRYFSRSGEAVADILNEVRQAMGNKSFKDLIKEHDAALRAEQAG